jgi:hypothetical protein
VTHFTRTSFSNLLGVNINASSPDIEDAVVLSIDSANTQIAEQDELGSYPESECLGYAKLKTLVYSGEYSSVGIWIEISNKLNQYLTVKLMELADR